MNRVVGHVAHRPLPPVPVQSVVDDPIFLDPERVKFTNVNKPMGEVSVVLEVSVGVEVSVVLEVFGFRSRYTI